MKNKKPMFKSKSLPGLSKEDLNKQTDAFLARSQFMKEAHKTEERKEISRKAGKKVAKFNKESGYFETEEFKAMCRKNGHNAARKTMENGTGLYGRTPEEKIQDCILGGKANTLAQQKARAEQIKIFAAAGTAAAAIAATEKFNAKIEEFIKLMPKGWISIKQGEAIKKENNIKRFSVRNASTESKYFVTKRVKNSIYFKAK